jgi:hypothetical protein
MRLCSYKAKNQHHSALYFSKLKEVRRHECAGLTLCKISRCLKKLGLSTLTAWLGNLRDVLQYPDRLHHKAKAFVLQDC